MPVYFAERHGLIKIGCSSTPARRVRNLHADMLATIEGGTGLEHRLHAQFAAERAEGEWFRPSFRLLHYIAGLESGHHSVTIDTPIFRLADRLYGGGLATLLLACYENWPALSRDLMSEYGIEVSHVTLKAWAEELRAA